MDERLTRLDPLMTHDAIARLHHLRVAVVGLGGVGGTALEALARSGVGYFLLIDHDLVQPSNLNRQILYLEADVGHPKVEIAQARIQSIDPDIVVTTMQVFIDDTTIGMLDRWQPDFIIDAIDSVPGKAALVTYAVKHHCPMISSLGMGNRIDPRQVVITTLGTTSYDPLAKSFRRELRKRHVDFEPIPVVFSTEEPRLKTRPVASLMTVTSTAGLLLAHHVLVTIEKR